MFKACTKCNKNKVSRRANTIKNNASIKELKKIYEFYSNLEKK